MTRRHGIIAVLLLAAVVAAFVWGRRPTPPVVQIVGPTMGGTWSVRFGKVYDGPTGAKLKAEVQSLLDGIDGRMSTWKPTSDLSRFNAHRGTDWFPVSPDVAAAVAESRRIAEETGGAFDATVGPVVNLWGFGPSTRPTPADAAGRVPADADVAAALSHVGHAKVEVRLDPPALRKLDPDVYVDLSGIAQGFAADRVADRLDAAGIGDYLVEVCGEMRGRGVAPHGGPWRVAVQVPVPDTRRPFRGVHLSNAGLATSGDYQNFFDANGQRFSHEIDPRTGRPVDHALASVTVVHPSAATADALATALMVLGPDAALAYATDRGLAVLLIVRTAGGFESRSTPAFAPLFITPPATGPGPAR